MMIPLETGIQTMPMRILITGSAGFIGRNLFKHLHAKGQTVIGIDDFSVPGAVPPPKQVIRKSVTDLSLSDLEDIDVVVQLAAKKSVPDSFRNTNLMLENIAGDYKMLHLVSKSRVKKILLASSCEVYGDRGPQKISETDPFNPRSPYAVSKATLENLAEVYRSVRPDIQITTLRFFNIYGPDEYRDAVIPRFFHDLEKSGCLSIEGEGSQARDFTFISDAIRVIERLIIGPCNLKTVNIGSGHSISILDLAKKIIALAGFGEIQHVAGRMNEISNFVCNRSLLFSALKIENEIMLERGLTLCLHGNREIANSSIGES
jgi:dTDP-glucose 4,6-dehydratase/UDP-glucose 4-epimerase